MSNDLIELALEFLTDSSEFEKLASEVMREEGYHDIKPLGGVYDKGRDAEEERVFSSTGKVTTIFQFTLEGNLKRKIASTLSRLAEAEIDFNELVLVTPKVISTHQQDSLKRETRIEFGIPLQIYERKTLVIRLADKSNDIFVRRFPDMDKQVAALKTRRPSLAAEDASQLEVAMLKSATVLTFGKTSAKARDSILDYMTLALVLGHSPDGLARSSLEELYRDALPTNSPSTSVIDSSLTRLNRKGLVTQHNDCIKATQRGLQSCEGFTVRANEATASLIDDIVEQVKDIYRQPLSDAHIRRIGRNTKEALISYFRLFGMELYEQFKGESSSTPRLEDASDYLVGQTKRQLPSKVGEILVGVLAEVLSNPSEEHRETIADWCCAFIGTQIMNLDPELKELEYGRLKKKTFILDTDFVLCCIVNEIPISQTCRKLVSDLSRIGCPIIVPDAAVNECITHAKYSYRAHHHFRDSLFGYSKTYIDETIGNVFVRGFYHAYHKGLIDYNATYTDYIRNYYDSDKPIAFLQDVIWTALSDVVQISNPTNLLSIELPIGLLEEFTSEAYEYVCRSPKAQYRTDDENLELARTDARLFLTTHFLNKEEGGSSANILGGSYYLVTSSQRYLRCAKRLDIRDEVTTPPESIVGLLEVVGQTSILPGEFMQLLANPFLTYAVRESHDDVTRLVESGIDLVNKSIPRLRCDLDSAIHSRLALLQQADDIAESEEEAPGDERDTDEFVALLKDVIAEGYTLNPAVRRLFVKLQELEEEKVAKAEEVESLREEFDALEERFSEFGKRKQRFLRRMARKRSRL